MSRPPVSAAPEAFRVPWVDHLKCFGIFLVVYGHSGIIPPLLDRWIYAFHIPLFFLLSGYLLRDAHLAAPLPAFCARLVRSLLPAYLLFAFFNYAAWLLLLRRFGQSTDLSIPPANAFLAIFYGTGTAPGFHLQPLILWFFPCLFSAQLLTWLTHRTGSVKMAAASLALSVLGFLLPKWLALPLELETAFVAQAFISLGIAARRADFLPALRPRWLLCLFSLALGTTLALLNERVDMRTSSYGNPVLFFGAGLALSFSFALAAQRFPWNPISDAVSRNTILIFPLHPFVFALFTGLLVIGFHRDATFKNLPAVSVTASFLNIALIILSAPVFARLLPIVYGWARKRPVKASG